MPTRPDVAFCQHPRGCHLHQRSGILHGRRLLHLFGEGGVPWLNLLGKALIRGEPRVTILVGGTRLTILFLLAWLGFMPAKSIALHRSTIEIALTHPKSRLASLLLDASSPSHTG